MKGDMRYTTTNCFENFPFPSDCQSLSGIGERYYGLRKSIAATRNVGLTDLYQAMHLETEGSEDIQLLRRFHAEMDCAVALAYGWADIDLGHGFHETRQGMRYTICEAARRKVLTRLLRLNHERYAEEAMHVMREKKKPKASKGKAKAGSVLTLFE
jgi:hypothetical protein